MTMLTVLTVLTTAITMLGGYNLGVFSARLDELAVYAFAGGSAAVISYLVGVPILASAPVLACFIFATWVGYASTYRIRSADPIIWAVPRLAYAAVTADFVAIVFVFVRYFAN